MTYNSQPCPVPGCPGIMRPRMIACRRCWRRLPRTIRAQIADAVTDQRARRAAVEAAAHWFNHHPLSQRDREAAR